MEAGSTPNTDEASGSVKPPVWVVRAGKGGRYANEFEGLGLIGIGFKPVESVQGLDRDALFDYVRKLIGSKGGNVAGQIDRFANGMEVGDLVAVPDGGTRELLYGRVLGRGQQRGQPEQPGAVDRCRTRLVRAAD